MEGNRVKMAGHSKTSPDELAEIWKTVENRYELLSDVASGKYGRVKKAKDRLSGQVLAIKLITNAFTDVH